MLKRKKVDKMENISGVTVDLVTKDMDKGDTTKISEKIVDLENTLVEDQVLLGEGFAATESIFERDKKKRHASGDSGFGGHEA